MNNINYENPFGQFPLSTQALKFSQDIVFMLSKLTNICGTGNYIISGCINTNGNLWESGFVVINGELLPFIGGIGSAESTVRIKEQKKDVVAGYETYESVYVERLVEFGFNIGNVNTFKWGDFVILKSIHDIMKEYALKVDLESLRNLMMPKGGIIMWSGALSVLPTGFALCDGSNVADYGIVPDLRGRFVVGVDPRITTSTVATNVTNLTENYGIIGSTGGKPNVTLKAAQSGSPEHDHPIVSDLGSSNTPVVQVSTKYYQSNNNDSTLKTLKSSAVDAAESHENRPPYFVLAYIIKVV